MSAPVRPDRFAPPLAARLALALVAGGDRVTLSVVGATGQIVTR